MFQVLKRHFARYTPELVEQVAGIPPEQFAQVCRLVTENSGRDKTTAFVYSLGWTQHTVGVQYIRTAAILQALLGNMGRPGGGIIALRGHASIQGSTDIPTLFDLLPGYLPMPYADGNEDLDTYVQAESVQDGFWSNTREYLVSLLKAWWGDAATADNDFCYGYLPRLTGSHSTYDTVLAQLDGTCKGYFLFGQNPAVGSANARMQRAGMANLDWLVVRDLVMIESATWWKDGPETEAGEMRTEDIGTEVFFLPAAAHTEKSGSFTNTQRMLQWHHQAVEPAGDARSDLQFIYDLGRRIRAKLAASASETDRPVLDLTWDYPTSGPHGDPDADAVLAEINGRDAGRAAAVGVHPAEGRRLHRLRLLDLLRRAAPDGVNQAARRKPASEQTWVAPEWGWAWPANRRILYNRASADPDGRPWSERKALVWWDAEQGRWTGPDVPDFIADRPPSYRPPGAPPAWPRSRAPTRSSCRPTARRGCSPRPGLVDGPLPAHYEPQESPFRNLVYGQQHNPVRQIIRHPENRYQPSGDEPGSAVFPYVTTTYRLTEHHTAGGMSRFLPYLAELQPALFCEVSPQLAAERGLEHLGWATVVTARARDRGAGPGHRADAAAAGPGPHRCTRSGCPGTGARTGTPPGTPPTSWLTWPWTRTCTSRRSRPWPATSARPAAGGAALQRARPELPGSGPASPTRPERRCEMDAARPLSAWTRRRGPGTPTTRRGWASSPTPRCASAARRARWPARSGTRCPRTGST